MVVRGNAEAVLPWVRARARGPAPRCRSAGEGILAGRKRCLKLRSPGVDSGLCQIPDPWRWWGGASDLNLLRTPVRMIPQIGSFGGKLAFHRNDTKFGGPGNGGSPRVTFGPIRCTGKSIDLAEFCIGVINRVEVGSPPHHQTWGAILSRGVSFHSQGGEEGCKEGPREEVRPRRERTGKGKERVAKGGREQRGGPVARRAAGYRLG